MTSPTTGVKSRPTVLLFVDQGASFGGSVVVIANLIRGLDPGRFRCIVVAEVDRDFIAHHVKDVAEIFVVRHGFSYVAWERLSKKFRRISFRPARLAVVLLFNIIRFVMNSVYFVRLGFIAVRRRVDVMHINNGAENLEANLLSIVLGLPQIVHVHGFERLTRFQRWFMGRVRTVVAISSAVGTKLLSEGVPQSSVITIPNPVLPSANVAGARDEVRKRFGIRSDALVFGIVGRIVPWKGQLEFLRAAELVLAKLPDAHALIVGDAADGTSDYQALLSDRIQKSGISTRVTFTGFTADVSAMYQAIDVAVHSSIEPEPFGLVITEAMSYGIPVVASPLGAPREIIDHGVTGYLVNPTETVALAARIEALLSDCHLRATIGARGREHVLAAYDARRYSRRMTGVYLGLAEREGGPMQ